MSSTWRRDERTNANATKTALWAMPSQIVNDPIVKTALTFGPSIRKATDRPRTVNLKAHTECGAAPKAVGYNFPVALDTLSANQSPAMNDGDRDLQALKRYVGSITKQTKGKRLTNYHCALCGAFAIRLHRLACKLSIQRTLPICSCPYTWNSRFGS